MMRTQVVQRLRVTFGIDGALSYASVLDLGRLWERLLRRAGLPLAYTQGFSPHPRLQFASALPVGYTSEAELLEVWLAIAVPPAAFREAVCRQAPRGLAIRQVEEVPLDAPVPQARMRAATYRVRLYSERSRADVEAAVQGLLARDEVPRVRQRKGRAVAYDLRPLIHTITCVDQPGEWHELAMELRCDSGGSGRPEEVADALDLDIRACIVRRTGLIWENKQE